MNKICTTNNKKPIENEEIIHKILVAKNKYFTSKKLSMEEITKLPKLSIDNNRK